MRKTKLWVAILALAMILALATGSRAAVVVLGERAGKRDYAGLSTDTKPTAAVGHGSTFYVTDTGVPYVYTGNGWVVDYRPIPPKS